MRDWSLHPGDPLQLSLAADFRLAKPDPANDHIWELEIGSGEPAALSLETTYGLRARAMRLFYRFSELGKTVTNPAEFHGPPSLRRFYPNFLALEGAPFEGLEASLEYWLPESHALAGRLVLNNRTAFARKIKFELCAALTPLEGQSFKNAQLQMINILSGQTSGLFPVLFMTGGPQFGPGPQPSLAVDLEFDPGTTRQVMWAQAALDNAEASFELARQVAGRAWEAERARIELTDAGDTLDIHTGDPDWDAALAFSQRAALGLFFAADQELPNPSFVQARQPDQGYARKVEASNHAAAWSGASPLESYYLASLLPAAPRLARGLVDNFLATQIAGGSIDNRPGLAGQRGKLLAAPMLASSAWHYFERTGDVTFLAEAFPKLLAFFEAWFAAEHDPGQVGLPAWDHILQTGFEDNPLFDVWHPWSRGVDLAVVHDPALEALLYREAQSLIQMAGRLAPPAETASLSARADVLRASLESSWTASSGLYVYRDRATDMSLPGRLIARHKGPGNMRPKAEFEQPVRLLIEVQTKDPAAPRPEVEIGELVTKGRGDSEVIAPEQFRWRSGGLVATSRKVFAKIGRIAVRGLDEKDRILISSLDTTSRNITLFTPLWARLPSPEHARVMVEGAWQAGGFFEQPYGIPAFPRLSDVQADETALSVHLPWNLLIGEGLLAYGFRDEAARLTSRLMKAVIQSLKVNRTFYQRYHAETGRGLAERGAFSGLAPVGLFLQTLGVTVLLADRVHLEGKNPFEWPVVISYKGLKIMRAAESTEIIFPNGRTLTVTDPAPVTISAS